MKKFTIGVDVGGTNVKFGLINPSGRIVFRARLATGRFRTHPKLLIDAIVSTLKNIIKENNLSARSIKGIGFGLPGLVDPFKGFIFLLPNIPGWKNIPFKQIIKKKIRIPVWIENDARLIALGEWYKGAGQGHKNLICVTLGTGVGSGLILNNRLYSGVGFAAGEIGHMPLNEHGPACPCGGYGCLERYVGNQALLKNAAQLFKNNSITLEDIYELAQQKNSKAIKFFDDMAEHIGNGLVGVVNLLNPELIIIGGGVSNNYKFIHKKIEETIKKRAMRVQGTMVKILRAQLSDDAGILGAKVLVDHANS